MRRVREHRANPEGRTCGGGRWGEVQRATKTNRKLDTEIEFKAITH